MFPIESFKNSLLKIVKILRRQEIPFHLTGGITGVAYSEPRLTQDIDIVIENAKSLAKLDLLIVDLNQSDFIFSADAIREAVKVKLQHPLMCRWARSLQRLNQGRLADTKMMEEQRKASYGLQTPHQAHAQYPD